MYEDFRDWIKAILGTGYRLTQGQWVEDQTSEEDYFCVLQFGGRAPEVDVRYPSVRVLLLGPRNNRAAANTLGTDAQKIMAQASSADRNVPCEYTNIRATGEPIGPGYTTENRAFYSLDFELIV